MRLILVWTLVLLTSLAHGTDSGNPFLSPSAIDFDETYIQLYIATCASGKVLVYDITLKQVSDESELGPIDVLVNNAAYCPGGPISSYSVEEWNKTFGINLTGMFVASRELVKKWQNNNTIASIQRINHRPSPL